MAALTCNAIVVEFAIGQVASDFRQTRTVGRAETHKIVGVSVNSLVALLALSATLFSSIVGQVVLGANVSPVEVGVHPAEAERQLFALAVVVLREAVFASMATVS